MQLKQLALLFLTLSFAFQAAGQGEFLGAAPVDHPAWFKTSFLHIGEDVSEARAVNKRLVIYFYQNGCPYCAKLVKKNFTDEKLVAQLLSQFDLIAINMWGDRQVVDQDGENLTEKQYASKHSVQFTPTLVFYNLDGSAKIRLNGYRSIEKFRAVMDFVVDSKPGQKFADYMAARSSASQNQPMPTAAFFSPPPLALARTPIAASRPLAVFFESKNCDDCVKYHASGLANPVVISKLSKMDVVQLDINGDEPVLTPDARKLTAKVWARELDITYAPSIVFFDEVGKEVFRTNGMLKAFHTQGVLEYVLSKGYLEQPSFQRFLEHYADQIRATGVDVDIWAD